MLAQDERQPIGTTPRGGPIQSFLLKPGMPRRPEIVRGEGIYLWDKSGSRYMDVSSGPVVNNLGHGNSRVLEAMRRQAEAVTFAYPAMFESAANVALADMITELAGPGLDRAFFVSGGSEATETAIKLVRQHAVVTGQGKRWKVIGREPGYHGATLGALSVTGDDHAEEVFGPLMRVMPKVPTPFTYRLPDNHTPDSYARHCAAALEQEILRQDPETVLAFIMEPVGGLATGALVARDVYFSEVRQICSRHGVLLIYDEVMSGAGRTGRFLAADHWPDARPDVAILAKGIAAGYTPFGAVLAPRTMVAAVAEQGGFMNGFTYFANPLSCAVGQAVVSELLEHDLIARADRIGVLLRERLKELAEASAIIGDVRGKGLLLAIELVADKATKRMIPLDRWAPVRFQELAMAHGLAIYCRRASRGRYGDWVMISPPLIISEAEIDEMMTRLKAVVRAYEDELARDGLLA